MDIQALLLTILKLYLLLSNNNQLLLLSRELLQSSDITVLELSQVPDVEPVLIMQSSLLDMEQKMELTIGS